MNIKPVDFLNNSEDLEEIASVERIPKAKKGVQRVNQFAKEAKKRDIQRNIDRKAKRGVQ